MFGRWVLTPADTRAARVHQPERKLSTVSPHPGAHPSSPTATGTRPLPKLSVLVKACLCAFLVGRTMPWVLRPCARGLWLPGGVPAPNPTAPARPRAPDLGRELPGAGTSLASLHIPGYSCGMAHSQCLKKRTLGRHGRFGGRCGWASVSGLCTDPSPENQRGVSGVSELAMDPGFHLRTWRVLPSSRDPECRTPWARRVLQTLLCPGHFRCLGILPRERRGASADPCGQRSWPEGLWRVRLPHPRHPHSLFFLLIDLFKLVSSAQPTG